MSCVLPLISRREERSAEGAGWKTCVLTARLALAFLLAAFLSACTTVSPATVARIDGFDAQWRGFNALKSEPFGTYETEIKVKVIVVEDMKSIGYPGAAGTYSHPDGVVRIVGKKIKGKIVLCPSVLGHEVQHALEYQDQGKYVNPDRLEDYGY